MNDVRLSSFVGRRAELERIGLALASARERRAATVVVEGEAGVGKSRLVSEALATYAESDDVIVTGHGFPTIGGELPFGAISSATRSLLRRVRPSEIADLGQAVTRAAELLISSRDKDGPQSDDASPHVLDAFLTVCEAVSDRHLLIVVFEDVHWIDRSSLDVVTALSRALSSCAAAVVTTVRGEEVSRRPDLAHFTVELAQAPSATRIHLRRFDTEDSREHVRQLTAEPLPPAAIERVISLSGGNPFLIELLVESGMRPSDAIASSVRDIVLAPYGPLSDETKQVVQAAAIASVAVTRDALARITCLDHATVAEAAVEAAVLLAPEDASSQLRFRHALIPEAVAASLRSDELREWHRRWAEYLDLSEETGTVQESVISAAHHWHAAGDVSRAFTAALAGAQIAQSVGAAAEQAVLLERALRLWSRVAEPARLTELTYEELFVDTMRAMGDAALDQEGLDLVEWESFRADVGTRSVWTIRLRLWRDDALDELGREREHLDPSEIEPIVATLTGAPLSRVSVSCLIDLGWRLNVHPLNAEPISVLSLELADQLDDPKVRLDATLGLAFNQSALGKVEESSRLLYDALALARATSPATAPFVVGNIVSGLLEQGDAREALRVGEAELRRISEPRLARRTWGLLAENVAQALDRLGLWDEAEQFLAQSRSILSVGWFGVWLDADAADLACRRGDLRRAEILAARVQAQARRVGDDTWIGDRLSALGPRIALLNARGDVKGLRHLLMPIWSFPGVEYSEWAWHFLLIGIGAEAGNAVRRRARTGRSSADSKRHVEAMSAVSQRLVHRGPLADAWRTQFHAELVRYDGVLDESSWRATVDAWSRVKTGAYEAWARLRLAECLVASGDHDEALDQLLLARADGARLGAKPLLAAIDDVARRGRVQLDRDATRTGPSGLLSDREAQVLSLVAEGLSNVEVARKLFISARTVTTHLSHIFDKLDAHSRAEAVAAARQRGLVR
jgi:DNA-binding CsgD family transcriptional regulator